MEGFDDMPPPADDAAQADDPFGLGPPDDAAFAPPEPLAGGEFGLGDSGGAPAEPLPSFGEDPMAAMGGGGDLGGMGDMGGGAMGGEQSPMAMGGGDLGGMGGGGMGDMGGGMGGGLGADFSAPPGGEMGPLAQWRMAQQEKLDARAAEAAVALQARCEEAQGAISTFYAELQEQTQKRAAGNKEAEARYIEDRDAAVEADSWETVCKLVDFKDQEGAEGEAAARDKSRFRQMLVQLKHVK